MEEEDEVEVEKVVREFVEDEVEFEKVVREFVADEVEVEGFYGCGRGGRRMMKFRRKWKRFEEGFYVFGRG